MRLLLVAMLASCGHPSPLGAFTESEWAQDCETPIVKENPRDPRTPGPMLRDGDAAFSRATLRYRCPPPGWAIYTDSDSRVIGLCVDNDVRPPKYNEKERQELAAGKLPPFVRVSELERAQVLITAHWGYKLAARMLKGTSGDHCSSPSEPVAPGMVRWDAGQFLYLDAPLIVSTAMCCWEVK